MSDTSLGLDIALFDMGVSGAAVALTEATVRAAPANARAIRAFLIAQRSMPIQNHVSIERVLFSCPPCLHSPTPYHGTRALIVHDGPVSVPIAGLYAYAGQAFRVRYADCGAARPRIRCSASPEGAAQFCDPAPSHEPNAFAEPDAEPASPAPSPFALAPIAPDEPCGPDLDLDGDATFLNFVAATEGLLPGPLTEDFYKYNRAEIDFAESIAAGEKLLARTLDVRLLVLLAKLAILNRDIHGFARRVGGLAWLIETHWETAHPRADGEDYGLRLAQLDTLDQTAVVLLPLQYSPLIETAREGALAYRDQLVASGTALPRSITRYNLKGEKEASAPEKFLPINAIQRLVADVELGELKRASQTVTGLAAAVRTIRAVTTERAGPENAVKLDKLGALADGMVEFLRGALFKRDPSLAPPPPLEPGADEVGGAAPAATPAAFASRGEVDAALQSALGYFASAEPTSPALLLIRQARETLGKNLYEVMKLLAPPHADTARVFVGPDSAFTVPVKSLSSAPSAAMTAVASQPAASREAALTLIDAVAAHMRRAEPSSPVPYLLERARNLATRDFLSLLQEVLPDEAIAALKKGK